MTGWYTITPAGPVSIGNLTPVGQNSGRVGCRWPPNGHHLAASLQLPSDCQLLGPFWYHQQYTDIFVVLPLPTYTPCAELRRSIQGSRSGAATELHANSQVLPQNVFCLNWYHQYWRVRPEHENQDIELVGGQYLISGSSLQSLWQQGLANNPHLQPLPWETQTLPHNNRGEDYQVKDEGGFFAEMTTFLAQDWSILVKIVGNHQPPPQSYLGAGATPVTVTPIEQDFPWLEADCPQARGGVLLTGALWQQPQQKISLPYPPVENLEAYAADNPVPWQSWKKVPDRHNPSQRVSVLTPGEWMTPAGAVYLWSGSPPISRSGPYPDPFNRHVLGYGHLWLFA